MKKILEYFSKPGKILNLVFVAIVIMGIVSIIKDPYPGESGVGIGLLFYFGTFCCLINIARYVIKFKKLDNIDRILFWMDVSVVFAVFAFATIMI